MTLREATALDEDLRAAAASLLKVLWRRQPVGGLGLVLSNLQPTGPQMPLFPLGASGRRREPPPTRCGCGRAFACWSISATSPAVCCRGTGPRGRTLRRHGRRATGGRARAGRVASVPSSVSCRCGTARPGRAERGLTVRGKLAACPVRRSARAPLRRPHPSRPGKRRPSSSGCYGQHPNATTELDFTTPFELLVATILSAQSSDARVNQVTPAFFKRYPDPQRLAAATTAELEPQIVATGFFRQKSKMLLGMAQALLEHHGGQVPADMDALTALPGVGRKTANVVLGHALGVPGLPVDRHVLRVANRIGIAQAATPEEVETQLCAALPREQWTLASSTLILHGRRICRPTQPLCPECAVVDRVRLRRRDAHRRGRPTPAAAGVRAARPPHTQPPARKAAAAQPAPAPGATAAAQADRAPVTTAAMPRLTRRAFERLVEEALATIPRKFRDAIANVAVVVEDEPTPDILDELEIPDGDTLYGLYQGTPLTERQWSQEPRVPDKVSIYQRPIEEDAESEDDIVWMIGETVIHEFGHYFGLSEDEIEAIEERYWRGEDGPDS